MDEIKGLSKEELVEKHDALIRSIAGHLRNRLSLSIEFDELVSYGRLGLLEAAERFDYKLGVSFKTFAYYRIRGAMYDGLRKMEVITRRKDPRLKFEEAATQLMASESSRGSMDARKPTLKEEIQELRGVISSLVPIYFLAGDAMDQLNRPQKGQSAEERAIFSQEKDQVRTALGRLSKNERALIQYYYYQDMTLEEAATKLGLSKSWASRMHAKAISKLKDFLQSSFSQKRS